MIAKRYLNQQIHCLIANKWFLKEIHSKLKINGAIARKKVPEGQKFKATDKPRHPKQPVFKQKKYEHYINCTIAKVWLQRKDIQCNIETMESQNKCS